MPATSDGPLETTLDEDTDDAMAAAEEQTMSECRKAVDLLAQGYLERFMVGGGRISHAFAWQVVSTWSCSRHTRHRPNDEAHMLNDALGVGCRHQTTNDVSSLGVGKASKSYPYFVRFLNRYLIQLLLEIQPGDPRATLCGDLR